jgi:hypothetical protein
MVSSVEDYDTSSGIHGLFFVGGAVSSGLGGFVHGGILHVHCTSWHRSRTKGASATVLLLSPAIDQVSDGLFDRKIRAERKASYEWMDVLTRPRATSTHLNLDIPVISRFPIHHFIL